MKLLGKAFVLIGVLVLIYGYIFTAYGSIFSTGHTVIQGHVDDAISRVLPVDLDDAIVNGGIVGTGSIDTDAPGQDLLHNSSGTIGIVSSNDGHYIQLGNDFTSSPGPDYHVYISLGPKIDDERDFNFFKSFELGKLERGKGPSNYSIPMEVLGEIDHLQQFSVVIWCKAFGEYIGSATVTWDTNR